MSIQEEVKRINQAKLDIKEAIRDKGVQVSDDELISDYAGKVSAISGGGGIEDKSYLEIINDKNSTAMGSQATFSATPYSIALEQPTNYSASSWSFPLKDDGTAYSSRISQSTTTYADPVDLGDFATPSGKRVDFVINGITCPMYLPCVCTNILDVYSNYNTDLRKGFVMNSCEGVVDLDFSDYTKESTTRTYTTYAGRSTSSTQTGTVSGTVYYVAAKFRNTNLRTQVGSSLAFLHVVNIDGLETLCHESNARVTYAHLYNVPNPANMVGYFFSLQQDNERRQSVAILVPDGKTLGDVEAELEAKNSTISRGEIYFVQTAVHWTSGGSSGAIQIAPPTVFAEALAKMALDGYASLNYSPSAARFNFNISTISSNELHLSDFVENGKILTFNYTDDASGIWEEPHTALLMTNDDLDLSGIDSVSNSGW